MKIINAFIVSLVLGFASIVHANPNICTPPIYPLIDSDLTTSRSFTLVRNTHSSANILKVGIKHDDSASGSVTRIDMVCYDVGVDTTNYLMQSISVSAGTGTSSDAAWQKTVSGSEDKNWSWRVDVLGFPVVKCTLSAGAGTGHANDRLDVTYQLCRG